MGRIARAVPLLSAAVDALRRQAGFAPLPWGLDLLLTDACNLRCTYCPIIAESKNGRRRVYVETEKAIRFFESIAHFRPMVRLIGGEPFLHPEWPKIVAAGLAHSLPMTVVTNGSLLEGRADELLGFLAIGISVDPPQAHDAHRGAGSFDLCRRVVAEIAAARKRRGSATPQIEIYTTVHEGTYSHLTSWAEQLAGWPIDTLRLQHEIWIPASKRAPTEALIRSAIGEATFFRSEVDAYCREAPPNVDGAVLEDQLQRLQSMEHPFRLQLQPPLPVGEVVSAYCDPEFRRSSGRPCSLTSRYAFVDPAGRLYPCLTLDMGNVFERPFDEVWNGAKYRAFRRLLGREERLPFCERCTA